MKQAFPNPPLLEIQGLSVTFQTQKGPVHAVREASLEVRRGEVLGLVGESGSGKSTVAFAIMGYLPRGTKVGGHIRFEGQSLQDLGASDLRKLRGGRIAMVYQDPFSSLNPTMPVGRQVEEVLEAHLGMTRERARRRTAELFDLVHLPEPGAIGKRYPHQLSGGMQQRVLIAMALACDPHLLLMDEPTTGLDVTTEATILDLVLELKDKVNAGVLFISHNLGVIARVADRVAVMYAGEVVEQGPVLDTFKRPQHPYTVGLLHSVPRPPLADHEPMKLPNIPGSVYDARLGNGHSCLFAARCPLATERCHREAPEMLAVGAGHQSRCFHTQDVLGGIWGETEVREAQDVHAGEPLLIARGLQSFYGRRRRKLPFLPAFGQPPVRALVNVDLEVPAGQTVGIVGESGSGKTTLARNIAGLVRRTSGRLLFKGESLAPAVEKRTSPQRGALRMIFQNPASSLNPRLPVRHALFRALKRYSPLGKREARQSAAALLEAVGLDAMHLDRLPSELSGGQQQRVALAAALGSRPDVVIADEAVSALDVSVQAQVLNLLLQHQRERGTSYIFITHDLGVVRYISDHIIVLYAGHVAESGPADYVLKPAHPTHPYTEALLSAAPLPDPEARGAHIRLQGNVPSLRREFAGCFFASRCPRKLGPVCDSVHPPGQRDPGHEGHVVYCHIPVGDLAAAQATGPIRAPVSQIEALEVV